MIDWAPHLVARNENGCRSWSDCLTCPYTCRHDDIHQHLRELRRDKRAQVHKLFLGGTPIGVIATFAGVSRKTVQRWTREVRR